MADPAAGPPPTVTLECVKVGSRLRVRVISPGYFPDANCQFPRALRVAGARYAVPKDKLRFVQGAGRKYYYSVTRAHVTTLGAGDAAAQIELRIYEDEEEAECLICMDAAKDVVLVPCGHYCLCAPCAQRLDGKCPMCRAPIRQVAQRAQINTI